MRVDVTQAIKLLRQGQVVAMPTETVYGLAGDARNATAIQKIYATKERPANNPLIVHLADSSQVLDWASTFPPLAQKLAAAFWPGPLTLVLPAKKDVLPEVRAGEPTVALRVPAHPVMREVLENSGLALAAPSANKYTQLSPTTATHVESGLGEQVPVVDGGSCQVGIESTIVYVNDDEWSLLRLGMVTAQQIEAIAGSQAQQTIDEVAPKAPGQHLLHYSPNTPIKLFASQLELNTFASQQANVARLIIGEAEQSEKHTFYLPCSPKLAAEILYDQLHEMDALGVDMLLVEMPPQDVEWLAICDRLQRAAHLG